MDLRHATFFFAPTGWAWRKAWNGKQLEQLMKTTFGGVRANLPAQRDAARLSRGREVVFTVVQVVWDLRWGKGNNRDNL